MLFLKSRPNLGIIFRGLKSFPYRALHLWNVCLEFPFATTLGVYPGNPLLCSKSLDPQLPSQYTQIIKKPIPIKFLSNIVRVHYCGNYAVSA